MLLTRVRLVSAPEREVADGDTLLDSMREGLRFVRGDRVLRLLIGGTGVIVLAAGMMNVAEVVLAQRDLGVGGTGFAALVAVYGVGGLLGSLAGAASTTLRRLSLGYVGGLGLLSLGLLATALAPTLWWALASFAVTGFGNALSMTHDRGLTAGARACPDALAHGRAERHDRVLGLRRRSRAGRHTRGPVRRSRRVRRLRRRPGAGRRGGRPRPAAPRFRTHAGRRR